MRVRHLSMCKKAMKSDTLWSDKDMAPKHAPIYTKTKPMRAGWKWRSSRALGNDGHEYIMFAECNPFRDKWNARLLLELPEGVSVVARFEFHGSHPGLHVHAHCERGGVEAGASGLDNLARIPKADAVHRRTSKWTEKTFWEAAKRFFRIEEQKGTLI